MMQKIIVGFVLGFVFVIGANAETVHLNAAQQLENRLKTYKTYSANFKQVTTDDKGAVLNKAEGKFLLERPGKFRWQSNGTTRQTIIANGATLWIYDVDLQQATKRSIKKNQDTAPAALLAGDVKHLVPKFHVTVKSKLGLSLYHLTSKTRDTFFQSIDMQFEDNTLDMMRVVNNLGQTSQFT